MTALDVSYSKLWPSDDRAEYTVFSSPLDEVTLRLVTLLPSPSDVVVSFTVEPSEPFEVLDLTDELDDRDVGFEVDGFDDDGFDDDAFDDGALDDGAFVVVASPSSVDSRVVVTSTLVASADRVVVCTVRDRLVGSVCVERVVTAPVPGSTLRLRVVVTPVVGSVAVVSGSSAADGVVVGPVPGTWRRVAVGSSFAVVLLPGARVALGAVPVVSVPARVPGPVVVVTASDDPGGASVAAEPRVGTGQPSGSAPPATVPAGVRVGVSVDPVPVEVASPGRSAVVAEDDGPSELLGPSIGIGQPAGATAGRAAVRGAS